VHTTSKGTLVVCPVYKVELLNTNSVHVWNVESRTEEYRLVFWCQASLVHPLTATKTLLIKCMNIACWLHTQVCSAAACLRCCLLPLCKLVGRALCSCCRRRWGSCKIYCSCNSFEEAPRRSRLTSTCRDVWECSFTFGRDRTGGVYGFPMLCANFSCARGLKFVLFMWCAVVIYK